ncbi:vWA domain-containing protein [Tenacibaculum amylolyticum]|uniref:vWA domain-containing protein n=1 Tax=Tenacibaculum amylolyticum TaxID=104269 RepID=UPI003895502B
MNRYLLLFLFAAINASCKNKPSEERNTTVITAYANEHVASKEDRKKKEKHVEIVFCLDATGSMSGLIGTAKEKIWDIVSELAQDNQIASLRLGMVFYRDRGDQFITKQIALTDDLDEVYSKLLEIEAQGGGDTPESVNQALHESINDMKWSNNKETYRTIFVVGDCPPHMDYQDDVKYTLSCKRAAEKGITINTIKLGNSCRDAIYHFKKMAECTNGEFLQLDQQASDIVIATPYDDEINKISRTIDESRLYYGNEEEQAMNYSKKHKSLEVYDKSSVTSNTARARYQMSKSGKKSWLGNKEIVNDYIEGTITVEEIEKDELPKELKGKSTTEIKMYLEKLKEERNANEVKLRELSKKQRAYIQQKRKEGVNKDKSSFSEEVVDVLKKQAEKK